MEEIPRYVARPLLRFVDYLQESMRLLHMSMGGIGMITAVPHSLTVLGEDAYSDNPPADPIERKKQFQKELDNAKTRAEFAEKECKAGFPLLHAHTVVGLWSALESAIEDAVVGILMNESELLQSQVFSKIRVPLSEFEALEKEERMRFLVEEVGRNDSLARRQGVDGFEALLAHVSLGGAVEPDVKKAIWELSHIRNVIVHRGSIADRRLVQSCPWMGLKVGDTVTVTHEALRRYDSALHEYLMVIIYRLGARYKVDVESKIRAAKRGADDLGD